MMADESRERWSDSKLEVFYQEFRDHVEHFDKHAEEESARVERFIKAFPNDDPAGHRQYHEAVIRAAEEQEKFWRELRLDVAKKSIWGVVTILVGLALTGVAVKFGVKP